MSKVNVLLAACSSCGAAAGVLCRGYELYVVEGNVRRDLGDVLSLKEAEAKIVVGSINYNKVSVFARQLPEGSIWAFRVNAGDSTPSWWRVP
jgi:hypothetical protein